MVIKAKEERPAAKDDAATLKATKAANDPAWDKFLHGYTKMSRAMHRSIESEALLLRKCRELKTELVKTASQLQVARATAEQDQTTIAELRKTMYASLVKTEMSAAKEHAAELLIAELQEEVEQLRASVAEQQQEMEQLKTSSARTEELLADANERLRHRQHHHSPASRGGGTPSDGSRRGTTPVDLIRPSSNRSAHRRTNAALEGPPSEAESRGGKPPGAMSPFDEWKAANGIWSPSTLYPPSPVKRGDGTGAFGPR